MNNNQHRAVTAITSAVVVILCILVIVAGVNVKNRLANLNQPSPNPEPLPSEQEPDPALPSELPDPTPFIDLQDTVETWANSLGAATRAGVMIYDITNNRTAATYHADEVFNVASIYKLLFAYDGYRQIALGLEDPNSYYVTTPDKGSLTLSNCLDLVIRESYNGCANRLAGDTTRKRRVSSLITKLGMLNTTGIGLESTAVDIAKLLLFYWRHPDLSDELWAQIADSMLHQPPSVGDGGQLYDWRQGLPAGFSQDVNVYNKVGWASSGNYWDTYADAAIVEFTNLNRVYIVVALTSNLRNSNQLTRLGQMIEQAVTAGSAETATSA